MKRLILICLLAAGAALAETKVYVNGQALNATSIESNGTIYVPVDAIARALGVEVTIKQDAVHISNPSGVAAAVPPAGRSPSAGEGPAAQAPPPAAETAAAAPAPQAPPSPPPQPVPAPKAWVQPTPPPNLTAIHGRLTWTDSIITTRPADYGARVWLVREVDVAALAKAAGGTSDEPIPTSATGSQAKLDSEHKFLKSVADGEGRFGFDNVNPGAYLLILTSRAANGLAARDRHGKLRFKKIIVHAGEVVDASFNFGVTAYKD